MGFTKFKWYKKGWNQIVKEVVDKELRPAAERIADRCNSSAGIDVDDPWGGAYLAGTEGDVDPLKKDDYRATVITSGSASMVDNMKNNTLVNNLDAGGL